MIAAEDVSRLTDAQRERCTKLIHAAFSGDAFWPSMHAAEALTMAGEQAHVQRSLALRLSAEHDDQHRCALARELVRSGDAAKVIVLLDILAKKDAFGHVHAAESLYKIGKVGDGKLLRQAFSAGATQPLRIMAAAALARCGHRDALLYVRGQLSSESNEQRELAAWILARLGDESDVESLRSVAKDASNDEVTQCTAFVALAVFGDPEGQMLMAAALEHSNVSIRRYAAEMASYCGDLSLVERLVGLLDDPDLDVRVRAAQSLLTMSQE